MSSMMRDELSFAEMERQCAELEDAREQMWDEVEVYGWGGRSRQSKTEADYDQNEDDYREDYLNGQS